MTAVPFYISLVSLPISHVFNFQAPQVPLLIPSEKEEFESRINALVFEKSELKIKFETQLENQQNDFDEKIRQRDTEVAKLRASNKSLNDVLISRKGHQYAKDFFKAKETATKIEALEKKMLDIFETSRLEVCNVNANYANIGWWLVGGWLVVGWWLVVGG